MPEASVNQNYRPKPRQSYVRGPREVTPVQPETESQAMEHAADGQFRSGVLRSDARHIGAALGRREPIHLTCLIGADANSAESYPRHFGPTRRHGEAVMAR